MTSAETKLWSALRNRGLSGAKARRQVAYGPYVLDFAVVSHQVVIEVDGDTHATEAGLAHDKARTAWLGARGWRVIRFTNAEVLCNLEGVLTHLTSVLAADPHPSPLPRGEGAGSTSGQ